MEKETKKKKLDRTRKPPCPECGSAHTYARVTTGEQVCQSCTHVWIPEDRKKGKEKGS